MAEQEPTPEQLAAIAAENEEEDRVNYRPPAQKSLQEIQELDKDDESLRKYKEALLGASPVSAGVRSRSRFAVFRPHGAVAPEAMLARPSKGQLMRDESDVKGTKMCRAGPSQRVSQNLRKKRKVADGVIKVGYSDWLKRRSKPVAMLPRRILLR